MHKLGLRIIIGYLLLTATLCAAVWFIVRSARTASGTTETERAVALQRRAVTRLTVSLIDAGTRAETVALQYADNGALRQYLNSVERVDSALANLHGLTADTLQRARLDSLHALVQLKRAAMINLIASLRKENRRGSDLQQQIADLRSGKKPVAVGAQVSVPVREHGEAVLIERRRKGFFHRLGDAFKRPKTDTLQVVSSTQEGVADSTLAHIDISDTLANILTDVHRDLTRHSTANNRLLRRQSDELRNSGAEISRRIALLMEDISQAQQRALAAATEKDAAKRTRAAWQMGGLALLATVAALCLFVWVWRDTSRANRYRMALEAAKQSTEELMKRREQLLLAISHDIKAPVNTIIGYLSLLKPHARPQTEGARQLEAIESSAHHLLQLVTALLDYHKLEAGGIELQPSPTQVAPLLRQIVRAFEPLAREKGLALKTETDLPEEARMLTDAFRLRQVIENLLSNAIKYTREGSVSLAARLQGGTLSVSIADTGCGLSLHDQRRIFEPFVRAKGSEGQEGTGLGLSITRQLAELLGGRLTLQSRVGTGSVFTLSLPFSPEAGGETEPPRPTAQALPLPQQETVAAPRPAFPDGAAGACAVALLDDDSLQLQLGEALLRNAVRTGVTVHAFGTAEALFGWLAAGNRPALLLTDIEMPALSGYDVLERVHKIEGLEALPVIATTSHSLVPATHFRQRGFCGVLFKPLSPANLREMLLPLQLTDGLHEAPAPEAGAPAGLPAPFAPLLVFADGDPEAEQAILAQFRADCQKHLDDFTAALAAHDKAALCRLAHKMLPTHLLIGAADVEALKLLEARRGEAQWQEADREPALAVAQTLRRLLAALA